MVNIVVRLYLLLLQSLNPQFQGAQSVETVPDFQDCLTISEKIRGPLTLNFAGPLELPEYILLEKEKNTNL